MREILIKLQAGKCLQRSELEEVFSLIFSGEVEQMQLAAFIFALSVKGETVEEIEILVKALRDRAIFISGFSDAIDVCGTGGDGSSSLNISTAVAFVVAASDIKVAKHGNRSVSSISGSADVLQELGVNINLDNQSIKKALEEIGIAFLFAPNFHPVLKNISSVRKALAVKTIFNMVGPLLNPCQTKRQLIGVYDEKLFEKYLALLPKLDYEKIILVSANGLDEFSLSSPTRVAFIEKGQLAKDQILEAEDLGLRKIDSQALIGKDAKYNAGMIEKIFAGEEHPFKEAVIANSALAISLVKDLSLKEAVLEARNNINSGLAMQKLINLRNL